MHQWLLRPRVPLERSAIQQGISRKDWAQWLSGFSTAHPQSKIGTQRNGASDGAQCIISKVAWRTEQPVSAGLPRMTTVADLPLPARLN